MDTKTAKGSQIPPRENKTNPRRFASLSVFLIIPLAAVAFAFVDAGVREFNPAAGTGIPFLTYISRAAALYFFGCCAVAAAAAAFAAVGRIISPRVFRTKPVPTVAVAAVLFSPVAITAIIVNWLSDLTVFHPLMLISDVAVLIIWFGGAVWLGVPATRRFTAARGVGGGARTVAGVSTTVFVAAVIFWGYAGPGITRPPAPGPRPNVLLISIDSLRRDCVGVYGGPKGLTPNLDRFATGAARFDRGLCCSPWTLPAMTGLITGRYPTVNGVDAAHSLRPGVPTLAQRFRKTGYYTEAYVTNIFMEPRYGFALGFDTYLLPGQSRGFYPFRDTIPYNVLSKMELAAATATATVLDNTKFNGVMTARALRRFGSQSRPFFLWCHFMDPHNPYTPPRGYVPDAGDGSAEAAYAYLNETLKAGYVPTDHITDPAAMKNLRLLYEGEIAYVDEQFGVIINTLAETGLAARTIVVVLNDHGEEFLDHGSYGHGHTLYPELTSMVLFIRAPGVSFPAGALAGETSQVDIAPTLLALAGIPAEGRFDGRSLLADAAGRRPDGGVFSEYLQNGPERKAIRRGDYLLIWETRRGGRELFDVAADPTARRDLAGTGGVDEEALDRDLAAWRNRLQNEIRRYDAPPPYALTEEHKARLRGLGYVGM